MLNCMKSVKTQKDDIFKETYASLNDAQRKAVDSIEGPVMVIAGPGTGKTQILTLRIANILKQTDVKPDNILALTFTDSGAKAMRERLVKLVGDVAYDVTIATFHGFADSIIRRYPEAYENIIGGRAVSAIERIKIVESILDDTAFKVLRPGGDPRFYIKPILGAIQDLKQEYISPVDLKNHITEQEKALDGIEQFHEKGAHKGKERGEYKDAVKYVERNRELLSIYQKYEAALRADKLYDFEDMIVETVHALEKNEDLLRDLQEQYQYVLADEHQDVNGSQNRILELITNFHDQPNLFVVGDEKQAIYRFQGASLDNFLYFEQVFKSPTIISLTDNYRSGQVVLDSAHALIKTDDPTLAPLRVPLTAKQVEKAEVQYAEFNHEAVELDWIVDQITTDVKTISPSEIAVIVRTNREVETFTTALRKAGVQVSPSADSDILSHPITHSIRSLIRFLTSPNDEDLVRILHESYLGLTFNDLAQLLRKRKGENTLVKLCSDAEARSESEILLEQDENLIKFFTAIESVKKYSTTEAPHRLLERLLTETGFIEHVLTTDPLEGVRVVRRIYDEVEGMVVRGEVNSLQDVVSQFVLHQEYGVTLNAPYIHSNNEAVQVMTAHKSKGLEFQKVYIPHMSDRVWGKKQSRTYFELPLVKHDTSNQDVFEDDERRLLYVAMTRAKESLVLSYAKENIEGKEQIGSRFLVDFSSYVSTVETDNAHSNFSPIDALSPLAPQKIDSEVILITLQERGLSPTALNNYLKSPWEYLYRNVLRVPQVKTTELQFGTAVHGVLDEMVRTGDINLSLASNVLKANLNREALSDNEFTRLHERGLSALTVFVETLGTVDIKHSQTEYHLEGQLETGIDEFPIVKLNGNLDRVDTKDGKVIRVVDYKTGKPKTRNHIEGKTKTSTGDYKRQLVFYALLLSLQTDSDKHCRTGVLSFVEPDKNGLIKEETFEVTDEEIEVLKQEIIATVQSIISGEALSVPCDPDRCHYCELVEAWTKK